MPQNYSTIDRAFFNTKSALYAELTDNSKLNYPVIKCNYFSLVGHQEIFFDSSLL